ncbi:DUF1549 domain-containing protein [Lignipirellula cremea]|uniref:DUF1549 domain-containing protein n=1 Tax=Lignipirellula cremea TaxID=2528010 RepID=A0A518DQ34_9BACT|nr:DUF1549 domain-containing protein [Lignipirellula cremea]QDU93956.1 hypothetical protein Pla8534_17420 [Lignipirellula cremea]
MLRALLVLTAVWLTLAVSPGRQISQATAATPLHVQIDQLIEKAHPDFQKMAAPPASDAEFFRRVHLDLVGLIPTAAETRAFLADKAPTAEKRSQLIARLLDSPEHARRMQYVFDEMLVERRRDSTVADAEWREYLRQSFQQHKPWDQLAEEILGADGKELRPAAKFYLARNAELEVVTRDVGRIFLGVDLECAQCHDHPSIDDYYQRHYFGINAFLQRTYLFTDPKTKEKVLGEKAEGEASFTSVFTQESGETGPRLMDLEAIPDPDGTEKQYLLAPTKQQRGVPRYSRRAQLARAMASDQNRPFRRNMANRLWALMMGRGLVEPLDLHTADNPPSHPEVLELLTDALLEQDYDLDYLLRELALTKTYQRSSEYSGSSPPPAPETFAIGLLKPLSSEQLAWSALQATGLRQVMLEAKIASQEKQNVALIAAAKKQAALPAEEPPGPVYEEPPAPNAPPETAAPLPIDTADLRWQEEVLHEAFQGSVNQFVTLFSEQAGQTTTFQAAPSHALFFINGTLIRDWLQPQPGRLTERLAHIEPPAALTEELFLAVLGREPTADEATETVAYLATVDDQKAALQELAWALLSSAEFRFNH